MRRRIHAYLREGDGDAVDEAYEVFLEDALPAAARPPAPPPLPPRNFLSDVGYELLLFLGYIYTHTHIYTYIHIYI